MFKKTLVLTVLILFLSNSVISVAGLPRPVQQKKLEGPCILYQDTPPSYEYPKHRDDDDYSIP